MIREFCPLRENGEKLMRKRLGEEMRFEPRMEDTVGQLTAGLVSEDDGTTDTRSHMMQLTDREQMSYYFLNIT